MPHRRSADHDEEDLIYEGIATSFVFVYISIDHLRDEEDLIYEGIATLN